jgi:small subunit ribosomal protein S21
MGGCFCDGRPRLCWSDCGQRYWQLSTVPNGISREVNVAEVRLQEGESLENALRRFKRKVQQEEIIKEVKRHSYYLKPGAKARVKQALARKRALKKSRKEQGFSRNRP